MTTKSYFPAVIKSFSTRLGNAYYSNIQYRPSDFYVMQKQNPVGWAFFAADNVNSLLRELQTTQAGTQFADIVDTMINVYETNADENPKTAAEIGKIIPEMNKRLLQKIKIASSIQNRDVYDYNLFLARPVASAPLPTLEREDRTIYIDRRNKLI